MPVVKIDSTHPETFFDVLKQMNIPEGAEIEVEKVESGILLKPLMEGEVLDRKSLRELLKEGAIEMSERDLQIAQEWFPLEEEVWEKHQ